MSEARTTLVTSIEMVCSPIREKGSLSRVCSFNVLAKAQALRNVGVNALDWIDNFIRNEGIDCDFVRCGRYHAAHTPKHYEELVRTAEILNKTEEACSFAVARAEQRSELGTNAYFSGVVFPKHASLDPAKYHHGLLTKAIEADVHVTGGCLVGNVQKGLDGFLITTSKGSIQARGAIIATNGYSGPLSKWSRRRIIPIGS